jgi:5'(3')-deoxyribonucleotidase
MRTLLAADGRLRIGVDLDGVLANLIDPLRAAYAREIGVPVTEVPMPCDWQLSNWQLDERTLDRVLREIVERGEIIDVAVYPRALAALQRAATDGHQLVVVTARGFHNTSRCERADTHTWLAGLPLPVAHVVFTQDKADADVDVLLDDAPHNVEQFLASGRPAFVIDRPWNRLSHGQLWAGPRLTDWAHLPAVLGRIADARTQIARSAAVSVGGLRLNHKGTSAAD